MDIGAVDVTNISMPQGLVGGIVTGMLFVVYAFAGVVVLFLIFRRFMYKVPVELFAREGTAIIKIKDTRAKERTSTKGSEYELISPILTPETKKEYFRIDDAQHRIPSRRGIIFKLIRTGFNDYHPIPIKNPDVGFKIIPQNNISWFANKVKHIHKKYAEKSLWNHPAILPMSFVAVAIIEFIIIMAVLDKVGQVGGTCEMARASIVDTVTQKIN